VAEIGCEANPNCTYAGVIEAAIEGLDLDYDEMVRIRDNTMDLGDNMKGANRQVTIAQEKRDKLSIELETETARCEGEVCVVALAGLRCRIEQSKKGY
jgi:hypothetical protein